MTVIASRRVGNAVARNRAKRITREAAARVAWRDGVDLVAICRAACAGSSTWPVHDDLVPLAERLGVTATSPVTTP